MNQGIQPKLREILSETSEPSQAVYTGVNEVLASFSSVTSTVVSSVFRGMITRLKNVGAFKGVEINFTLEYPCMCELIIYNDAMDLIKAFEVYVKTPSWTSIFIPTGLTVIQGANFYIGFRTKDLTGFRMHPGTVVNSSNVSAAAGKPNYYFVNGSNVPEAVWNTTSFSMALKLYAGYTTVAEKYQDISKRITGLAIPSTVYAVVGLEYNIYFDNVIGDDIRKYYFDCISTVGVQQAERWTYTPAAAGSYSLVINMYDLDFNLVATKAITVIVVAANEAKNNTVLFIGDSTSNSTYQTELYTLMDNDENASVTFIGTQGSNPRKHEGHSGWELLDFFGQSSPFVNGGNFDFSYYLSNNGLSAPTIVSILLGINDVFYYESDSTIDAKIADMKLYLASMITSIRAYSANIKILIGIPIWPSASQDSFGKSYNSAYNRIRYKRNIHKWGLEMIKTYDTSSVVKIIGVNLNLDTLNNMQSEEVAVNSRNSATVTRQSNGLHPAASGYQQMADTFYYVLKGV